MLNLIAPGDAGRSEPLPPVLTAADLARLLRVHPSTVRRLVARGDLPPPVRVGRALRWKTRAVLEFLDDRFRAS